MMRSLVVIFLFFTVFAVAATTPEPEESGCTSCAVMLCITGTICTENNGCGKCVNINTPTQTPPPTCHNFRGIVCPDDSWECVTNPCTMDVCIPERSGTCRKKPTQTPKGCRSNSGAFVPIGSKYFAQCNSCTCGENGQGACTKKGCPQDVCWNDQGKQIPCSPVNCFDDPCNGAVRDGLCTRDACIADYSTGCNFICTTPAPTTTREPIRCMIQGGPIPAECQGEGEHEWDSTICAFVCKSEPPIDVCSSCAAMLCFTGTTCIEKNGCGTCVKQDKCPQNLCEDKCEFKCIANYDTCTYQCKEPSLGETVRTISFHLRVSVTGQRILDKNMNFILEEMMREIASKADISSSSLVINNADFYRTQGYVNSKSGIWFIKIGFRAIPHPEGDERAQFIRYFTKLFNNKPPTITTDEPMMATVFDTTKSIGLVLDENQPIIQAKEFYEFQTCQDGRTITADKQCQAVATSSSSSIPIVAIIAPIIGGIVLVAIIAIVALIIRRRRVDTTIKTMENIARDTATIEMNPAAVQAQAEGADRV